MAIRNLFASFDENLKLTNHSHVLIFHISFFCKVFYLNTLDKVFYLNIMLETDTKIRF